MPIHWVWIVVVLFIIVLVFGAGRLVHIGGAAGNAVREFRKGVTGEDEHAAAASRTNTGETSPSETSPKG